MVKSKTRRDAEILVRNPSPRLFGEKFRESRKVNIYCAWAVILRYPFALRVISDILWSSCFESYGPKDTR